MKKKITRLISVLVVLLIIGGTGISQTSPFADEARKDQKTWGSYLVSGVFGTNYLFRDITGDKNLFLSQFNLKDGLNVGEISFQAFRDPEKDGVFDVITLDVYGFNAQPYGRASFKLEKRNLFSLTGGYTERKYFADVASFANPLFDADSDDVLFRSFHTWNTKEKTLDLSSRIKAAEWLSFDALWQRTKLQGDSTTTLSLLPNEFPLTEPVDQTSQVFKLGSELNVANKVFYKAYALYQSFVLNQTASSTGENVGIRGLPSGSSALFLTGQSRKTKVDLETWAVGQSIHMNPLDKLTIDGSYVQSWTDGTSSADESMEGRFFWPLYDLVSSASYTNSGELKKDYTKGDFSLGYQVHPRLQIRAGYDHHRYRIENSDALSFSFMRIYYNRSETGTEERAPLLEVRLNKYFTEADLDLGQRWAISFGYARSNNDLEYRGGEEGQSETYSYGLGSFYGSVAVRITQNISLTAKHESGSFNRVFTRAFPMDADSTRLEGRFSLNNGLSGSVFYRRQKLANSGFSYSSKLDGYGGSLRFQQSKGLFGAFLHVSRNDFSSTIDIIRTISLFIETEDSSVYNSDVRHASIGAWFRKGRLSLSGGYSLTDAKGTFPVKMNFPYLTAAFKVVADLALTLDFRSYDYDEKNFTSQNYRASIFNIGFAYDF